MLRLAAGRFEDCPFDEAVLEEMAHFLGNELGLSGPDFVVSEGQTFLLGVIGPLLKALGDPDCAFSDQLKSGARWA